MSEPTASDVRRAGATLLSLLAFFALGAAAALRYPGGTYWDPLQVGFGWESFWCDLLRPIAHSGASNERAVLPARLSLVALAIGLGPFFRLTESVLPLGSSERWLSIVLSSAGRLALILVAAGTGRFSPRVHDWSILIGGPLGLVSLTLTILWTGRARWRGVQSVGLLGLAAALWNLIQYAREALGGSPSWPGLPMVQKAATLLVLGFVVAFCVRVRWPRTAVRPLSVTGSPDD